MLNEAELLYVGSGFVPGLMQFGSKLVLRGLGQIKKYILNLFKGVKLVRVKKHNAHIAASSSKHEVRLLHYAFCSYCILYYPR